MSVIEAGDGAVELGDLTSGTRSGVGTATGAGVPERRVDGRSPHPQRRGRRRRRGGGGDSPRPPGYLTGQVTNAVDAYWIDGYDHIVPFNGTISLYCPKEFNFLIDLYATNADGETAHDSVGFQCYP